jgi:polysulfide reductase chain C
VPLVGIGTILLIVDLGNQLDFWHLVVRFYALSPMSVGTWLLILWAIVAVALLALWLAESGLGILGFLRPLLGLTKVLSWIAFVLSPLLITYTGVLLSTTNTALWATILLPVLFVVSAVATGLAATLLVATLLGEEIPAKLGQASTILEGLEVLALIAFLIVAPAGVLVSGTLALWFWLGVIVVGMLVPTVLELLTWKTSPRLAVLAATVGILLGGLVLRAVIVVGGQI